MGIAAGRKSWFFFYLEWNGSVVCWEWELRAVRLSFKGGDGSHNRLSCWKIGKTENIGKGTKWLTCLCKGNGLFECKLSIYRVSDFCGLRLPVSLEHELVKKSMQVLNHFQESLLAVEDVEMHIPASLLFSPPKNNFFWWNGFAAGFPICAYRFLNFSLHLSFGPCLTDLRQTLHLLLEYLQSTLFLSEPQSCWNFTVFCSNCFRLYNSTINWEVNQSTHLTKQNNFNQ